MPGKFDSCKKGALQSPRATVKFVIGYKVLAIFASRISGSIRIFWSDVHQYVSVFHHDAAYAPNFNVLRFSVSRNGFSNAFVSLKKQKGTVAAQAYVRSTMEMKADAQLEMLQNVIYPGL